VGILSSQEHSTSVLTSIDADQGTKLHDKYAAEADRYRDEQKELEAKAHELEQDAEHTRKRADRFDLGEALLEIGLVITSITLLSGRNMFWFAGIVLGIAGVAMAVTALLL
jgi:hypothetical protein